MADARMTAIATQLLEKTKGGEVDWRETVDGNAFTTAYPDYSLSIRSLGPGGFERSYVLAVHNGRGTEAGSLAPENQDPSFQILKELFELARRKGVGTDEVLDDVLKTLSGKQAPS